MPNLLSLIQHEGRLDSRRRIRVLSTTPYPLTSLAIGVSWSWARRCRSMRCQVNPTSQQDFFFFKTAPNSVGCPVLMSKTEWNLHLIVAGLAPNCGCMNDLSFTDWKRSIVFVTSTMALGMYSISEEQPVHLCDRYSWVQKYFSSSFITSQANIKQLVILRYQWEWL